MNGLRVKPEAPGGSDLRSDVFSFLAFTTWFVSAFNIATIYLFFQSAPKNGTAVSILASCVMLMLAVLARLIFGGRTDELCWHSASKWIFAYLAFTGLSLSWTPASSLLSAFGYWLEVSADVLVVIVLLGCEETTKVAVSSLQGFVCGTLVVAVVAWCAPGTGDLRLGQEDFLHPNGIGYEFAIATLFCVYLALRTEETRWKLAGAGLAFSLLRTLSKSSIIAFVCAVTLYMFGRTRARARTKLKILFLGVSMGLLSWGFVSRYLDIYSQGSSAETLTGRTAIWWVSWDIARDQPWLGHGFYSYRSIVPYFGVFEAWQAHNEWLQQFFSYGVVGLSLAIVVYVSFFRHLRRSAPTPERTLAYALLVFALVHGLTEASYLDLELPTRLMLLLVIWCGGSAQSRVLSWALPAPAAIS